MVRIKIKEEGIIHEHSLRNKKIDIVSCEEHVIENVQDVTGDVYKLRYLGIDAEYKPYLALEKDKVLGYSVVQKYFENYYIGRDKGRRRGEPALVYSLKRKKGIGSLLFLVSSLEILKDDKVEVFRCEAVEGNVFDRLCSQLELNFSGKKDIFNSYELVLEKNNRKNLENKIKDYLKSL